MSYVENVTIMRRGDNMEVKGYMALFANRTDRNGVLYEEGKDYHTEKPIDKNGMLTCVHLSDVFRNFDPNDVTVAEVIASGELKEISSHNWQESYTDLYLASDLHVERFLSREEIMAIMKTADSADVVKFFATYNPTEEEAFDIVRACNPRDFENKAKKAFLYFIKKVNIYAVEDIGERRRLLEKVLDNGQDSSQRSKGKQS